MLRVSVYLAVAFALADSAVEATFKLTAIYPRNACNGPPSIIWIEYAPGCVANECSNSATGSKTSTICSSEAKYRSDVTNLFGGAPFILRESYGDASCTKLSTAAAFKADGGRVQHEATGKFVRGQLEANGSVSVQYFTDASCSAARLHHVDHVSKAVVGDHSCDTNAVKWYAHNTGSRSLKAADGEPTANSTVSSTASPSPTQAAVTTAPVPTATPAPIPSATPVPTPTATPAPSPSATPATVADNSLPGGDSSSATASPASKEGSTTSEHAPTSSGSTHNSKGTSSLTEDSKSGSTEDSSTSSSSAASPTPRPTTKANSTSTKAPSTTNSAEAGSSDTVANVSSVSSTADTTDSSVVDDSSSGSKSVPVSTSNSSFSTLTLVGIAAGIIAVAVVGIAIIIRRVRSQTIAQTPEPGAGFLDPYLGQTSPYDPRRHNQQRNNNVL
ncbi:hypothetical protein PF011_g26884 [Phytophthora fragariae]|uniref:Uncharacterized protein n=1 Tax=Phytophthora fragariae TaxID=53985 RepID=A0A6A3HJW4_9STRA|nr:hypothetical protein PF011_g26884 [Phytophthora fragariae]